MTVDQKILEIVWGETARLRSEGGSTASKGRLQAVIGSLAERARKLGSTDNFKKSVPLPPVASPGGDQSDEMRRIVEEATTTGNYDGIDLPRRAVIWEVTATGEPREADHPLPPWARWIREGTASRTSDFTVEGDTTRRLFRLYESNAEPGVGDVSFVSGYSNSGVPPAPPKINYWSAPWLIGFASVLLFVWMAITLSWTGRSVTQAVHFMEDRDHTNELVTQVTSVCNRTPGLCQYESGDPVQVGRETLSGCTAQRAKSAATAEANAQAVPTPFNPFCRVAWSEALKLANQDEMASLPLGGWGQTLFGWATASPTRAGATSIATPMAGFLLSIVLLCIALGLGQTGRVFGVWISPQNRVSLARAQVTLWTVVILGAYAAFSLFNTSMMAESIRDSLANNDAQGVVTKLTTFPEIPMLVLGLLGISFATTMLSAVIKSGKPEVAKGEGEGRGTRWTDLMSQGPLEQRPSPQYASLADLFLGEQEDNKSNIDVSRLQNVVITLTLVCGYGALLFGLAREAGAVSIMQHLADKTPLFPSLPDPRGGFVGLAGISQGTYLLAKAVQ